MDINQFETFIIGDIKYINDGISREESIIFLSKLEMLMIKYNIGKIDISIDPFNFPIELTFKQQTDGKQ